MPTEEQIKELAHAIWEQENRPEGKDLEHYFHAKKTLEDREKANVIELAPPPSPPKLPAPLPTLEIMPPLPVTSTFPHQSKGKKYTHRKKKQ